jgi:hypothetical protein
VVGFDLSEAQLAAARVAMGSAGYGLVQGAADWPIEMLWVTHKAG